MVRRKKGGKEGGKEGEGERGGKEEKEEEGKRKRRKGKEGRRRKEGRREDKRKKGKEESRKDEREGGRKGRKGRKDRERGVWLTFTISCAVMDPMTDCIGQASPLLWWANLAKSRSSNSSTCGRTSDQSDKTLGCLYIMHHMQVTIATQSPISLIKSVFCSSSSKVRSGR